MAWDASFFITLAGVLGRYVCMDGPTERRQRLDFARILVEISEPILEPLKMDVRINGVIKQITVEKEMSSYHDTAVAGKTTEKTQAKEDDSDSSSEDHWYQEENLQLSQEENHDDVVLSGCPEQVLGEHEITTAEDIMDSETPEREKIGATPAEADEAEVNGEENQDRALTVPSMDANQLRNFENSQVWQLQMINGRFEFSNGGWRVEIPNNGSKVSFNGAPFLLGSTFYKNKHLVGPEDFSQLRAHCEPSAVAVGVEAQQAITHQILETQSGSDLEDQEFQFSDSQVVNVDRKRRGRKKILRHEQHRTQDSVVFPQNRKRGRPRGSKNKPQRVEENRRGHTSDDGVGVETRAQRVWRLGKKLGLVFSGSEEVMLRGLEAQINVNHPQLA